MLSLTKHIPAHDETFVAMWYKKDFHTYGDCWRQARKRMDPLDHCWWCDKAFENGDKIAIACFPNIGNKVLCQSCAIPKDPESSNV